MYNSGKWRASFAALAAALVFVTGIGAASSAQADYIAVGTDDQVVDPNWCKRANKYDHRVWLSGSFETDGRRFSAKRFFPTKTRYFSGCYRILPNGRVETTAGALKIHGSESFIDGYRHGEDIALNGVGVNNRPFVIGTFEINGVQTRLDGRYSINSLGEVWYENEFHHLGVWSDWYEAGVRNGHAAAQRKLDVCFSRISLASVEPKTYGPELTFEVSQYLPEVPAERVVVGFREVSEGSRQPQVISGKFPWCVDSWFRYDTEGPRFTIDLGRYSYGFAYDEAGPYYQRHSLVIPGWEPRRYHNEDLWNIQRLPVMG